MPVRWHRQLDGTIRAEFLSDLMLTAEITVDPLSATISTDAIDGRTFTPDQARAIGARLIEAAAHAEGLRTIAREASSPRTFACAEDWEDVRAFRPTTRGG